MKITTEQLLNEPLKEISVKVFDLVEICKDALEIYGISHSLLYKVNNREAAAKVNNREAAAKLNSFTDDIEKRLRQYIDTDNICEHLVLNLNTKEAQKQLFGCNTKYVHKFGGKCF